MAACTRINCKYSLETYFGPAGRKWVSSPLNTKIEKR
jgi:hypothetical protein